MDFARLGLDAGVNGLTVHPRPDLRHIRPDDARQLGALLSNIEGVEFNIEGNPLALARDNYPGFIELVEEIQPDQCTLVPDSDSQKTSDHGFNLERDAEVLAPIIERLQRCGSRVSLFMDPLPQQIKLAKAIGADRIELYTGPFAWAYEQSEAEAFKIFEQHCIAARWAKDLGLGVNAGHDLNLANMQVYKTLPGLREVSIGHALTVDALKIGFEKAVKAYLHICS